MRRLIIAAAVASMAAVAAPLAAGASGTVPVTLALYGDAPYGTSNSDTAQFQATPAFVAAVNADPDVSEVVHVGDIHSGKQYCTEAYDRSVAGLWTGYSDPLVYTPGDNEWADCHKKGEGGGTYNATTGRIDYVLDPATGQPADYAGGDPIANQALVRSVFFPTAGRTLGTHPATVVSQATAYDPAHPEDAAFVENVRWERNTTLFVTLDVPGGSNNDADIWYGTPTMSTAQSDEITARTAADLRWLDSAFTAAGTDGMTSVVVYEQADMWDLDGKPASHVQGYNPFVDSLASHSLAFGKPVLLVNGDSHLYRSDNPLDAAAPCTTEVSATSEGPCASEAWIHSEPTVPNFHRLVVHGSTSPLEWLKLTVSTKAAIGPTTFGPFKWRRMPQS